MGPDGISLDDPVHVRVSLSSLAEGEKVMVRTGRKINRLI